jgi:hypothetical protein
MSLPETYMPTNICADCTLLYVVGTYLYDESCVCTLHSPLQIRAILSIKCFCSNVQSNKNDARCLLPNALQRCKVRKMD